MQFYTSDEEDQELAAWLAQRVDFSGSSEDGADEVAAGNGDVIEGTFGD
jgi:hypothetical protein